MRMLGWIAMLLAGMVGVLWMVPPELARSFIREGGPEEWATAWLYGVVLLVAFYRFGWRSVLRHWTLALVPVVFMMRELDFDKRFTSSGLFTSRFYLRAGAASPAERAVGWAVMVLLMLWGASVWRRYGRYVWAGFRKRAPEAIWFCVVMALVFAVYALDGFGRKVRKIGLEIGPSSETRVQVVEETLELGIPLAMLAWLRARGCAPRHLREGEHPLRRGRGEI